MQFFNDLICLLFMVSFMKNKVKITMTLKNILLLSGLLLLTNALHNKAHSAIFITGLQGGYGHGHAKTASDYSSHNLHPVPQKHYSGVHGPLAGLFLGLEFEISKNLVFGLETNATLSSIKNTETVTTSTDQPDTTTDTIKQKLKSSLDLLLKIAYQLDPVSLYFKVGPSYGRWQFQSTAGGVPLNYSKTKGFWGAKIALGVEGDISKNFAWGVEYSHTFLQSYTLTSF